MQTLLKKLYITLITFSLFSFVSCTQVPEKDTTVKKNTGVNFSTDTDRIPTEAGDGIITKSSTIGPCVSRLEENKLEAIMDTITGIVQIKFYCLCSDYLTDVKVKLSNRTKTYTGITDKLGCNFVHIQSGTYLLEVDYPSAKKFKPTEVQVRSGGVYNLKIFLCEE